MLTLMPNARFHRSLNDLAPADLDRVRHNTLLILQNLVGVDDTHEKHPSVRMWNDYEYALAVYGAVACMRWVELGGRDEGVSTKIMDLVEDEKRQDYELPIWMGDLDFHRSHRSLLIRARPEEYAEKWPNTPEFMPIIWPQPTKNDPRGYRLRISTKDESALKEGERKLPEWLYYDWNKREILEVEENEEKG